MKTFLLTVLFAFLLTNSSIAYGCMCSSSPSVCGAYAASQAVFIGSVQKVKNRTARDDEGKQYNSGQLAYVQVEKSFKGAKEAELVFRSRGTSCDATFEEGQRWLFYANYDKKSKSWGIGACGRSREIEFAAEDLLYLQALPGSAETTRISGTLYHYENDPLEGFNLSGRISGAKVRISDGQKTYETFTDKDGVYEIYGLPPGKYTLDPEVPPGLGPVLGVDYNKADYSDNTARIVLEEKSCGGVSFFFTAHTSVRGKVYNADGVAMKSICLNLMPKDKPARDNWLTDSTDDQGNYELHDIPPGEYIIVVNCGGKISSTEPFPVTYYPGVSEKEKAGVLTITAGARLEDYDIRIPPFATRRTIKGVLLFSDGHPVASELVEFEPEAVAEGYNGTDVSPTDAQGRFTLRVLDGLRGSVRGFMYTSRGEFENCPNLDKLIKAGGESVQDIGTKPMPVEVNSNIEGIKLVLPWPNCAKAKPD